MAVGFRDTDQPDERCTEKKTSLPDDDSCICNVKEAEFETCKTVIPEFEERRYMNEITLHDSTFSNKILSTVPNSITLKQEIVIASTEEFSFFPRMISRILQKHTTNVYPYQGEEFCLRNNQKILHNTEETYYEEDFDSARKSSTYETFHESTVEVQELRTFQELEVIRNFKSITCNLAVDVDDCRRNIKAFLHYFFMEADFPVGCDECLVCDIYNPCIEVEWMTGASRRDEYMLLHGFLSCADINVLNANKGYRRQIEHLIPLSVSDSVLDGLTTIYDIIIHFTDTHLLDDTQHMILCEFLDILPDVDSGLLNHLSQLRFKRRQSDVIKLFCGHLLSYETKFIDIMIQLTSQGTMCCELLDFFLVLPADLKHIFETFFKLETSGSFRKHKGFLWSCFWMIQSQDVPLEKKVLSTFFTFDNDCKNRTVPRFKMRGHCIALSYFFDVKYFKVQIMSGINRNGKRMKAVQYRMRGNNETKNRQMDKKGYHAITTGRVFTSVMKHILCTLSRNSGIENRALDKIGYQQITTRRVLTLVIEHVQYTVRRNNEIKNRLQEKGRFQASTARRVLTSLMSIYCVLQSTESIYMTMTAYSVILLTAAMQVVKSSYEEQPAQQKLRMYLKDQLDLLRSQQLRTYLKEGFNSMKCPYQSDFRTKGKKSLKHLLSGNFRPSNTDLCIWPVILPVLSRFVTNHPPTREETMAFELLRLCTMHDFPNPNRVSFFRLAQAGFFYTGNGNELVCYSCGFSKNDWSETDDPLEVHRTMSPSCAFFDNQRSTNTPVRYSEDAASQRLLQDHSGHSRNVLDLADDEANIDGEVENYASAAPTTVADSNLANTHRDYRNDSSCPTDSASMVTAPRLQPRTSNDEAQSSESPQHKLAFPQYKDFCERLSTFTGWNKRQLPRDLAHCGLFYTKNSDCVRCFDCGIGLKNWDPDDNPWIEHARWSSKCNYLISIKGHEFITLVMEAARAVEEPSEVATNNAKSNDSGYNSTPSAHSANVAISDVTSSPKQPPHSLSNTGSNVKDGTALGASKATSEGLNLKPIETRNGKGKKTNSANNTADSHSKPNSISDTGTKTLTSQSATDSSITSVKHSSKEPQAAESAKPEGQDTGYDTVQSNTDYNAETLKKEIKQMSDQTICKICLDAKVEMVFLPCGHLVCCTKCSPSLRKCPICRQRIKGSLRAHVGI